MGGSSLKVTERELETLCHIAFAWGETVMEVDRSEFTVNVALVFQGRTVAGGVYALAMATGRSASRLGVAAAARR